MLFSEDYFVPADFFPKFEQKEIQIIMNDATMTDIFISYRRVDGREHARTIQLALGKEGYQNVFFDYDSMRDGMFNDQILTAISHCKDFILILSPQSMIRCANEGDWVAREIQAAIESGCKIIPVQINDPFTNWPADLPRKFNFIKQIEFLTLRTDEYFDASIKRLVSWLDSKPCTGSSLSTSDKFTLVITVDETCELHIDGQKLRKIRSGMSVSLENVLKPGKTYDLTFISLASKTGPYRIEYTCSDTVLFGRVDVSFAEIREKQNRAEKLEKERKEVEQQRKREHEMLLKTACSQYDESWKESDAMTAVMRNNKIGYLNSSCFEAIPCIYDNASEFCNGYATVCLDDKWGIIDKSGHTVVPFESDIPCYDIGDYKYFVCSKNGSMAISTIIEGIPDTFPYENIVAVDGHVDLFLVRQEGLWNMINAYEGEVPFKTKISGIRFRHFNETVGNYEFKDYYTVVHKNKLCRGVDWKVLICTLPLGVMNPDTGKYAYLNSKLEMTIPFVDEGSDQSTECGSQVIIKCNGKMGVADAETGKIIIPTIHDYIRQIYLETKYDILYHVADDALEEEYIVTRDDKRIRDLLSKQIGGLQGVIDGAGKIIVPQIYQAIYADEDGIRAEQYKGLEMSYDEYESYDLRVKSVLRLKYKYNEGSADIYNLKGEREKRYPIR